MSWSFQKIGHAGAIAAACREASENPLGIPSEHQARERAFAQIEALAADMPPHEVVRVEASGSAYQPHGGKVIHNHSLKFEHLQGFVHHHVA